MRIRWMGMCVGCLFMAGLSYGQTFGELFNQNSTQRKYLIKQIALIKLYGGYIKKGYEIAKGGLDFISAVRDGELNLFKTYFGSLKTITPAIAHYQKVADIIAMEAWLIQQCALVNKQVDHAPNLPDQLSKAVIEQLDVVRKKGEGTLSDLLDVITAKKLEMTDDQRMRRIDALYNEIETHVVFLDGYGSDLSLWMYEVDKQQQEETSIRTFYGWE